MNLVRLCFVSLAFTLVASGCSANKISGRVIDSNGPVPGATVRIQTADAYTISDGQGQFAVHADDVAYITAWASGYYIAGVEANPGKDVEIYLEAHTAEDNPEYEWRLSTYHSGEGEDQGCAACHSQENSKFDFSLPVDEWLQDAHAQTARNHRFLTMYTGQDIGGNQSPLTRYGYSRDYGSFPLRPDLTQPYYGPGYKLDFPETAGNCAACHTPLAAIDDPYGTDPTSLTGVDLEGISCDFCHKIWDVRLDPATGLPSANMPGVLSLEFRRPPADHQLFFGPLDDVAPGEDTYSPLQEQSQFCAPCHFSAFWDTQIYNSFGEWLESSYSDPNEGQTCQDCHMPTGANDYFVRFDKGGLERDPATIFSHRMPGASDTILLQNAVSMSVDAYRDNDKVIVEVSITNDQTGHHVPTDSPLRQMILLVNNTDSEGNLLPQINGPTVPDWGGVGNPLDGYYAQMPGTAYAKILMELWTEVSPTGAYWNPTRVLSDNRIPAMESDTTRYVFDASSLPEESKITVSVNLLFRRAFIDLMDQKGWDVPDIVMESQTLQLP